MFCPKCGSEDKFSEIPNKPGIYQCQNDIELRAAQPAVDVEIEGHFFTSHPQPAVTRKCHRVLS